jgi:hypothetical protein
MSDPLPTFTPGAAVTRTATPGRSGVATPTPGAAAWVTPVAAVVIRARGIW